jgi:hypothetical protein
MTCDALSQLPRTLPHSLIMLGGGTCKAIGTTRPRMTPTSLPSHTKGGWDSFSPLSLLANNHFKRHVITLLYGAPNAFRARW